MATPGGMLAFTDGDVKLSNPVMLLYAGFVSVTIRLVPYCSVAVMFGLTGIEPYKILT